MDILFGLDFAILVQTCPCNQSVKNDQNMFETDLDETKHFVVFILNQGDEGYLNNFEKSLT